MLNVKNQAASEVKVAIRAIFSQDQYCWNNLHDLQLSYSQSMYPS